MDNGLEEKIRKRAYEIWERDGCSGDPEDHWREAEQELTGANQGGGPDRAGAEAAPSSEAGQTSGMSGLGAMAAGGDYSGWTAGKGS